MTDASVRWNQVARVALIAGVAGGVAIDAFLYVVTILPQHGSIVGLWQYVASALLGKIAFSSPSYAALGFFVHFTISIAWAAGYAYLAEQRPYLYQRPAISGIVYGFIVYIFMQIVLIASNNFVWPANAAGWLVPIIAHTLFFGLPVSLTASRVSGRG